jgi:hypothetical protein
MLGRLLSIDKALAFNQILRKINKEKAKKLEREKPKRWFCLNQSTVCNVFLPWSPSISFYL